MPARGSKTKQLGTIAYWIMEKGAHSKRLRASINQIAQVAIDLSVNRGKSALTILKADKRRPDALNRPLVYWNDGLDVAFETETGKGGNIDLGGRVKQIRNRQSMPQKELAALVGVTPSTISQIESGTIYPSLPALFKNCPGVEPAGGGDSTARRAHGQRVVCQSNRDRSGTAPECQQSAGNHSEIALERWRS